MSVRELRRDRPSWWFSKSRGLSASVSFLSSPPPPRSFTCATFLAVFDSRSFLLNRTETLATQATVTDVSTTCAVVIFRVKVSCITSVDGQFYTPVIDLIG